MGRKLYEMINKADQVIGYMFECPGCGQYHAVHVAEKNSLGAQWTFNGNMEKPTFAPSLKQTVGPFPANATRDGKPYGGKSDICHLFVRDGVCEFLGDCTHKSANQKIPLPDIEDQTSKQYEFPT